MPFYEHVFIARQDLSQAQVDSLAESATQIVSDYGGSVHKTETWGLRKLAYKIAKNRKGHYVMLAIEAPGDTIAELERRASLSEDIVRWLSIRTDELEKGPSVMMRKQDRRVGRSRGRDGEE